MNNPVIDSMFPTGIYELYNERLVADQPIIDCIVASIKFEIWYRISEGFMEYRFLYDTNEWLFLSDQNQKLRVIDGVIRYFRARGIRSYLQNYQNFNQVVQGGTPLPGTYFNYPTNLSTVLCIEWFVRQGQEYMKAYL